ncbi:hypothetical protein MBLNU13_g05188t1 [Cladosporium sp. NU13]
MSQIPSTVDHSLALLPPHILEEIQASKTEIGTWYMSGGVLSAAPVDALTKVVREILAAGNRSLNNLTDPATRQAMSLENSKEYLNVFREVLEVRAGAWLDVADLTADAERVKSGAQQHEDGLGGRDMVAKWTELATMSQGENDLARRFGEQVVELEAEEGLR